MRCCCSRTCGGTLDPAEVGDPPAGSADRLRWLVVTIVAALALAQRAPLARIPVTLAWS